MADILSTLENVIREKRHSDPNKSYVAKLTAAGREKMAQKVGEEAVETILAAMSGNDKAVTGEAADLLFHLLVLLADCDLSLSDILNELAEREGVSGLTEKANRSPD